MKPQGPAVGRRRLRPRSGSAYWWRELGQYRQGPVAATVVNVPEPLRRAVRADPERHLPALVDYITGDTTRDADRIRRIHDWIAHNIEYDLDAVRSGGEPPASGVGDVMSSGRAVCGGFSSLFAAMSDAAGVESVTILGHARGRGFDLLVGGVGSAERSNHAWNAVRLDGEWALVDATWGAGHVDESDRYVRAYTTSYLFLHPEAFIYTHLPADPAWQLLREPVSGAEFDDLPYLTGEFFAKGIVLDSLMSRASDAEGEAHIDFRSPPDIAIDASLCDSQDRQLPDSTFVERDGLRVSVFASFPRPGLYVMNLFARSRASQSGRLVARFGFRAKAGSATQFPYLFGDYAALGCNGLEPRRSPLLLGSTVVFGVRAPGAVAVALVVGEQWRHLERGSDNRFSLKASLDVASTEAGLYAQLHKGDANWKALVRFGLVGS